MIRRFICYSIFFLTILLSKGYCQEFHMLHYTLDDGLPTNNIYEIYRDTKGFLWFASDKGIARYNGIKFEKFTIADGLPDDEIFFFKEDYYGRIWMGTYNGKLCYYENDHFHSERNTPFLKVFGKASFIEFINLEKDSSLVVGFYDDNIFLNIGKNWCKEYHLKKTVDGNIKNIRKISDSLYEIYYADKRVRINTKGDEISSIPSNHRNKLLYEYAQNVNYYLDNEYVYNEDGKPIWALDKNRNQRLLITRVYFDGVNKFYATIKGLFINDTVHILKQNKISSVTQDNIGNYWISTLDDGVYCLSRYFFNTRYVSKAYVGKIGYSCVRKNRIFFATSAGNSLYELNNSKVTCLLDESKLPKDTSEYSVFTGCTLDEAGKYFSYNATRSTIIDDVLVPDKKITHYKVHYRSNIKKLLSIGNDVYIQPTRGIIRLNYSKHKNGDEVRCVSYAGFDDYRIFCIDKSANDHIWYATINGTYKIQNDQATPVMFSKIAFRQFKIYGQLLIGFTQANQLMVFRNINNTEQVDTIAEQNCVWDNIYMLDSNNFLLSTNNFYRLLTLPKPCSAGKPVIKVIEDPFIPLQAESICTDTANCYFFKHGSIVMIHTRNLFVQTVPPCIFFTTLITERDTIPATENLEITYKDAKNLAISFATISTGAKDVDYQYIVFRSGESIPEWRELKSSGINLLKPYPGEYTIKVRARTVSNTFSAPAILHLEILKPYWATWWFILLCGLFVAFVFGLLIRVRVKRMVKKQALLMDDRIRFMKSEYKAMNALMNPHFIFNTLNTVQGLFNQDNNKRVANDSLKVFADLIRQNMQNVANELIPLQKEVDLVTNYLLLEKLRFGEKLNYTINIADDLDISEIMIPPMLIQPLVENAIKHGILPLKHDRGLVTVSIYEQNNSLFIEVVDNGIGLQQAHSADSTSHISFALHNIRQRIEQLSIIQGRQITFEICERANDSGQNINTTATVSFPL